MPWSAVLPAPALPQRLCAELFALLLLMLLRDAAAFASPASDESNVRGSLSLRTRLGRSGCPLRSAELRGCSDAQSPQNTEGKISTVTGRY